MGRNCPRIAVKSHHEVVKSRASTVVEGRKGGVLWAPSAAEGKKLAEYNIESPPVFDGMIAANGQLYISTRDGRVLRIGMKLGSKKATWH